mgnify:CR=1 FL=1
MAEQINDRTDEEQMIEENTNIRSYLTFIANGLTYGVDTMHVVEIITDYSIRPVPEYIKGIINLRGQIIPIIDFRLRLGCMEDLESNSTIILQVESNTIGMMVDSVSQVLDIDLRQTSSIPVESRQELTNGMVSLPDGTVILLLNYEALVE